jgi:hypothetical protein
LFVVEAIGLSPKFDLNQNISDELIACGLVKNKPFASNFWKNHHGFKPKKLCGSKNIFIEMALKQRKKPSNVVRWYTQYRDF